MFDYVRASRYMEVLLHGGHRHHPLMRVLQMQACLFRLYGACLEKQDAGNELEAVGDPVLHFLKQQLLLL